MLAFDRAFTMKRALFFFLLSGCSILELGKGRPYAVWTLHGAERPMGTCATIEPRVVKSGAEGVGFLLEVRGRASCTLALAAIDMSLADESVQRPIAVPPMTVEQDTDVRLYTPLPFDNRAAWNRGSRSATVVVRGTIDGRTFSAGPWTMDHEEQK